MQCQNNAKNSNKILPSMHESRNNSCSMSSYGKHGLLRNKNCVCLDSIHAKSNFNDGAIVCPFDCNKTIYKCQSCATLRNFCKDYKAARWYLREHHELGNENIMQ